MSFEIGERVTNSFTGPGTVLGPMERDEDGILKQRVLFDNPLLGERLAAIRKLNSLESEGETKAKVGSQIQKEGGNGA